MQNNRNAPEKKYRVHINEFFTREVTVSAESESEAQLIVGRTYYTGKYDSEPNELNSVSIRAWELN